MVSYTYSYLTYRLETCSLPETAHFESVTNITTNLRGCTQDRLCPWTGWKDSFLAALITWQVQQHRHEGYYTLLNSYMGVKLVSLSKGRTRIGAVWEYIASAEKCTWILAVGSKVFVSLTRYLCSCETWRPRFKGL